MRFPFLTTGSRAHLPRQSAVAVAIAPSIVWGIVLIGALLILPRYYRLTAYVLLTLNIVGAAGDYVEECVVSRQRPAALIQDDDENIYVYVPLGERSGETDYSGGRQFRTRLAYDVCRIMALDQPPLRPKIFLGPRRRVCLCWSLTHSARSANLTLVDS